MRKFRQHPLSHIPGGCVVKYIKVDGHIEEYDWVTYPENYISDSLAVNDLLLKYKIDNKRGMIAEVYVDNVLVWDINDQEDSNIQHKEHTEINKEDMQKIQRSASRSLANIKKYCKRKY